MKVGYWIVCVRVVVVWSVMFCLMFLCGIVGNLWLWCGNWVFCE